MFTHKTKRIFDTVAMLVIWAGAIAFALLGVFPAHQNFSEALAEIQVAETTLRQRLEGAMIPSKGAIESAGDATGGLTEELRAAREFYARIQRNAIERDILESSSDDPYIVAANFRRLRQTLEEKAGVRGFLELGDVVDWPDGSPAVGQIPLLEKKTSVAKSLVNICVDDNQRPSVRIRSMTVGDPYSPASFPERYDTGGEGAEFRILPVVVDLSLPVGSLGQIFTELLTVDRDESRPLVALRSVGVAGAGEKRVDLRIELNVLDFSLSDQPVL